MLSDFVTWIRNEALPLWADRGFDLQAGRFRERLDASGEAITLPHRSMVQARQIFVFAHAADVGWFAEGGMLAEQAMAALLRDFERSHEGMSSFDFSIDPVTGQTVSAVRDAYAHAFLLFAIAALYRLNGDPKLLDRAERIIRFIDGRMTDPGHGGLFDALPAPAEKRQNPHMHLLEALLFLDRAAPRRGYIERAGKLVDLFRRHFLRDGLLLEYFTHDWRLADRAVWEPGHHFEWVWLLGEYATFSGEDVTRERDALYDAALSHGIMANGAIADEMTPNRAVLKSSSRVWPHTEAIKAAATRHAAGDQRARRLAEDMAATLMRHFLGRPFAGGWIDHRAADGAALVDYVPASSLYHLVLAASVAAKGFAASPALAKADA